MCVHSHSICVHTWICFYLVCVGEWQYTVYGVYVYVRTMYMRTYVRGPSVNAGGEGMLAYVQPLTFTLHECTCGLVVSAAGVYTQCTVSQCTRVVLLRCTSHVESCKRGSYHFLALCESTYIPA